MSLYKKLECKLFDYKCEYPRYDQLQIQCLSISNMPIQPPKRRSERLSRRKFTVIKKAQELAQFYDADVALIIHTRKDSRYYTYNSTGLKS
jgi:hypothetical protein